MEVNPTRVDAENEEFYEQEKNAVLHGKLAPKDIVGFDWKEPSVFVPSPACGALTPSLVRQLCKGQEENLLSSSLLSLLPLYDTVIYPVLPKLQKTEITEKNFNAMNGLSLDNFVKAIEERHVIPYFVSPYKRYDLGLVQPFLRTGVPRISFTHMTLIQRYHVCELARALRSFTIGGENGQKIYSDTPIDKYVKENLVGGKANGRIIDPSKHASNLEFETKFKQIPDRLYTQKAREIARERLEYMRQFFERLKREIDGQL